MLNTAQKRLRRLKAALMFCCLKGVKIIGVMDFRGKPVCFDAKARMARLVIDLGYGFLFEMDSCVGCYL